VGATQKAAQPAQGRRPQAHKDSVLAGPAAVTGMDKLTARQPARAEQREWNLESASAELAALVGLDPAWLATELGAALRDGFDSAAGALVALVGEESDIVARTRAVQILAGLRAAGQ
jgi:hypothetical protein